jgi:hypothetical protein
MNLTTDDIEFIDLCLINNRQDEELLFAIREVKRILEERKEQKSETSHFNEELEIRQLPEESIRDNIIRYSSRTNESTYAEADDDEYVPFTSKQSPIRCDRDTFSNERKKQRRLKNVTFVKKVKSPARTPISPGLNEMRDLFKDLDGEHLIMDEPKIKKRKLLISRSSSAKFPADGHSTSDAKPTKFSWPSRKG